MTYELGIIGAGRMAEAIARGVLQSGHIRADQMIAADVSPERREFFQKTLGIRAVDANAEAVDARAVLLSVKPYQMKEVLASLGEVMNPQTLVLSIAAGISSKAIESALGAGKAWRVVRTMPNTPMLVGEGMVAMAAGANATAADLSSARRIFETAAAVIEVPESKIDAVTAMSGSGPAYFFFLVEQMIKAGIELGLTPEESRTLAAKTATGAAKMMLESKESPAELRRNVTTPNGTTHAAISHMESQNLPAIVVDAIKAAAKRSRELGA